jgi:tetratricopeptide (TPR) repeat protein
VLGRHPHAALLVAGALAWSCTRPAPAAPRSGAPQGVPARSGLDKVVPPPPRCLPDDRVAGAARLAAEAERHLDAGVAADALRCADEAVRADTLSVAALRARARALAASGRTDEARAAFGRALAVDPTDPRTLLGAAGLLVEQFGGDREALETGLAHALRGARVAGVAPGDRVAIPSEADRDLAAQLLLVAAMAENDLGRSREALGHADAALTARPGDDDIRYERGVALYELCRFGEAEAELSRVLAGAPNDAWTIHYLGLAIERRGDRKRAEELLRRAETAAPAEFGHTPLPAEREFAELVQRAVAALSAEDRRLLGSVPLEIQDLPALDDLVAVDPPLSPSILGLFRGPPADEPCTAEDGPRCRSIVFYRKNLARMTRDREELAEQVKVTLLHELGHLRGETDEELRDRGLE